jgi:hypothetical protein
MTTWRRLSEQDGVPSAFDLGIPFGCCRGAFSVNLGIPTGCCHCLVPDTAVPVIAVGMIVVPMIVDATKEAY